MSTSTTRLRLFVAVLLAVGVLLPAAPAGAAKSFTFYGGGWGHGVGLSQYGAYGLAQMGWGHIPILKAFYTGVTIGVPPSPPPYVRVGLTNTRTSIAVKAVNGPVTLRTGNPVYGTVVATVPNGQTWTILISSDQRFRIRRADMTFVGNSYGSKTTHLYAQYGHAGASVYLPATAHTYKRGWMEFNIYQPCSGCAHYLRAIVQVAREAYVYGISEVPSSWPSAALRAQAIAARTYAYSRIAAYGQNRPTCNCGVYGTTSDQVYAGADKEDGYLGGNWVAAVDATAGQTVNHSGTPITAYYHSSSGGLTEANEYGFGGSAVDYLRSRCDRGDWTTANPNRVWTVKTDGASIGNSIHSYTGTDVGDVTSFSNIARGDGGYIVSVTVNGTQGSTSISGATFRRALGLKTSRVFINSNRNVTGHVRDAWNAKSCAPRLATGPSVYYTNGRYQPFQVGRIYVNLAVPAAYWLHGPILSKYIAMGGHGSILGLPRTHVHGVGTDGGLKANFDKGRIYWHAATGAHEMHGAVLDAYIGQGNKLGFPVTDVVSAGPDKVQQTYQNGSITCTVSTGACTTVVT